MNIYQYFNTLMIINTISIETLDKSSEEGKVVLKSGVFGVDFLLPQTLSHNII